jgi:hypothetical protein
MVRDQQDLTRFADIGEAIASAIREIVTTGTLGKLEKLRAQVTPAVASITMRSATAGAESCSLRPSSAKLKRASCRRRFRRFQSVVSSPIFGSYLMKPPMPSICWL